MMPLLIMKLSENKFKAQADKPVHCSYVLLYITTAEVSCSVYFWWNGRSSAARLLWKHIEAADFFVVVDTQLHKHMCHSAINFKVAQTMTCVTV